MCLVMDIFAFDTVETAEAHQTDWVRRKALDTFAVPIRMCPYVRSDVSGLADL